MSAITTHVLDTAQGKPARGVPVTLEVAGDGGVWSLISRSSTDADGRIKNLLPNEATLVAGKYRLVFDTGAYFDAQRIDALYPVVTVTFDVRPPGGHYHIPLLLSPYGYSTYRGS